MTKPKPMSPTEETVMTMPVGALEAMGMPMDSNRHDGLNQGMRMDGSPTGKNEPFMCYKRSSAEDYVVVKIIHVPVTSGS